MRARRLFSVGVSAGLAAAVVVAVASAAPAPGTWRQLVKAPGIVDVVGPRADGRLVLSTRSGLFLLRPGGSPEAFAAGGGYTPAGGEPYVALAPARRLPAQRCSWHQDDVYALDADATAGIVRITRSGRAARFVDFPAGVFPSGIAFDLVGRFGYRLLVAGVVEGRTTIYAIDCLGKVATPVQGAPRVEGGMAVAPPSFARFAGDLIAPDENSGRIYAFGPRGGVALVAESGLRAGGDLGVEGVGFVPTQLGRGGAAYFSDLGAPGSPTEGTESLLVLRGADLARAALRPGELVAATEAGATTIAVRCARRPCTVRHVADGPAATHGEGHVTFVPGA